jgi:myo-inositol-1(or 4)-monophosphatase
MQQYLETAKEAARAAGHLIRERFPKFGVNHGLRVEHKGRIDLVTEVDLASEAIIRKVILAAFPQHQILGEEGGQQGDKAAPLWVVDPLDGTRSFAHGFPFVSVCIALEINGQVELGVVYDPLRDELFEAVRGKGAMLNGIPIGVSQADDLSQSLLASGFPYQLAEIDQDAFFNLMRQYIVGSGGFRRAGSAALDLCYVACGRLDGYWEFFLKPWDAAAGALIALEAGAKVTRLDGNGFSIYIPEFLVCSPKIHSSMIEVAKPYLESIRKDLP